MAGGQCGDTALDPWPGEFCYDGLASPAPALPAVTLWVILPLLQAWLPTALPGETAAHNSCLRVCFLKKQTGGRREVTLEASVVDNGKGWGGEGCTPRISCPGA